MDRLHIVHRSIGISDQNITQIYTKSPYNPQSELAFHEPPVGQLSGVPPGPGIIHIPGQEAIHVLQLHIGSFHQGALILAVVLVLVFGEVLVDHVCFFLGYALFEDLVQDLLGVLVVSVGGHLGREGDYRVCPGGRLLGEVVGGDFLVQAYV